MTALILGLFVSAAPPNAVEVALRRPLSPGAVALLLEHRADPRVAERIAAALGHADAPTRAAAARVAHVAALGALAPRLRDALSGEADVEAAREQAMALLALDPESDGVLLGAARRLGPTSAWPFALALAAGRGEGALSGVAPLREAGLKGEALVRFLEIAGRGRASALAPAAETALGAGDLELWDALVAVGRRLGAPLPTDVLAKALARDDDFREGTLEALVLIPAQGEPRPPALQAAIDAVKEVVTEGRHRFALAILDRLAGRPAADQVPLLEGAAPADLPFLTLVDSQPRLRDLLSAAERTALGKRLGLDAETLKARAARREPRAAEPVPIARPRMFLAEGYPRGFIEGALASSGCTSGDRRSLGGLFRRDTRGRPVEVVVYRDLAITPQCVIAAYAVVAAHLRPLLEPDEREGQEIVLLPVERDVIACLAGPQEPSAGRVGEARPRQPRGRIQEPRKVRSVKPRYPQSAHAKGYQGTSVLDALLTPAGCVGGLRLARSSGALLLDVEAFLAVAQWRYTPTLLDGQAVPVNMTITVNFKMQ